VHDTRYASDSVSHYRDVISLHVMEEIRPTSVHFISCSSHTRSNRRSRSYDTRRYVSCAHMAARPELIIGALLSNCNSVVVQISSQTVVPPQLVAITQHTNTSPTARGPPLAVGRLAVDLNMVREEKGKAVHVLHTWKDHLFDLGCKGDPPGIVEIEVVGGEAMEGEELKTGADPAGVQDLPDADVDEVDGKDIKRSDVESKVGSPPSAAPKTHIQPEVQLSKEGDIYFHLCCQLTQTAS